MSPPFYTVFPSRHLPITVVSGTKQEIKLNFKAKGFQRSHGAGSGEMELKVIKASWNLGDYVWEERDLKTVSITFCAAFYPEGIVYSSDSQHERLRS